MDTKTLAPEVEDTEPADSAPEHSNVLIISDRCDQCGAQAYVGVLFGVGDLLFCAHHYKKYAAKLEAVSIKVIDERWKLEPRHYSEAVQ